MAVTAARLLPRTLRGRMVAVTVLVALGLMTVLVVLTQVFLARSGAADARDLARARAQGVEVTVRAPAGRLRVLEGATDALDRTAWVFDAGGRLLDGTLPRDLDGPARAMVRAGVPAYRTVDDSLLYAEPLTVGGQKAVVVATVDVAAYERAERRTLWVTIALGTIAVITAGVAAREVARHSLAVVHRMSANADAWQEHDLDRRFGLGPPRDEIGELGQTLDRMLDRISGALAAERRLTDEIAHELRNPLAVIRGEAQLAQLADGLGPEGVAAIVEATERMETAVTTVLAAARARDRGDGSCRLAETVRRACGPDVEVAVPGDVVVAVSGDLVAAVLAPLLDNARRHARTRVRVHAEVGDGLVELRVLDDGPGIPPADTEAAFAPGWSSGEGHGLGLAVVRRLARAAGVDVRAVGAGHGELVVTLPLGEGGRPGTAGPSEVADPPAAGS